MRLRIGRTRRSNRATSFFLIFHEWAANHDVISNFDVVDRCPADPRAGWALTWTRCAPARGAPGSGPAVLTHRLQHPCWRPRGTLCAPELTYGPCAGCAASRIRRIMKWSVGVSDQRALVARAPPAITGRTSRTARIKFSAVYGDDPCDPCNLEGLEAPITTGLRPACPANTAMGATCAMPYAAWAPHRRRAAKGGDR